MLWCIIFQKWCVGCVNCKKKKKTAISFCFFPAETCEQSLEESADNLSQSRVVKRGHAAWSTVQCLEHTLKCVEHCVLLVYIKQPSAGMMQNDNVDEFARVLPWPAREPVRRNKELPLFYDRLNPVTCCQFSCITKHWVLIFPTKPADNPKLSVKSSRQNGI